MIICIMMMNKTTAHESYILYIYDGITINIILLLC